MKKVKVKSLYLTSVVPSVTRLVSQMEADMEGDEDPSRLTVGRLSVIYRRDMVWTCRMSLLQSNHIKSQFQWLG